jgi:FkbM family methyltransferase
METLVIAFASGSLWLSLIVLGLSAAGLARKAVFVAVGVIAISGAIWAKLPHQSAGKIVSLARKWRTPMLIGFVVLSIAYFALDLRAQFTQDLLTRRLSEIGHAHGHIVDGSILKPDEALFLFAFVLSRYSAAALLNFAFAIGWVALVLCCGLRLGHPGIGVAAAFATYGGIIFAGRQSLAYSHLGTWFGVAGLIYLLANVIRDVVVAARRMVPVYAWVILLVLSPWIISFAARPTILKTYFSLEQRWPEGSRKTVESIMPGMCRIGLLGPARVEVEPGLSFVLDPRDLIGITILRYGFWQQEVWDSLAPDLKEGSVFLDVGAHIGYFSIKAVPKVGRTGRVVSFEPNPETLVLLRDNVRANHAGNVVVEPIACTDRDQMLTLYAAPSMNTGASSLSRENADLNYKEPPRPYPVHGRPIDEVVRELGLSRVDAIKVDVEGAEVTVLRGAFNTLRTFHPKVVIEIVAQQLASFQTTPDQLISILKDAGYNHSKPVGPTDWEWTVEREELAPR